MFGKNSSVYKRWKQEWNKYKNVPFDIEVANLGSSGDANNFAYELWEKKGFNFASAPQDMYYDNQVLEQYGDHLVNGAILIICISEFALLVDKYEEDSRNYKYYGYLEPKRILNYSTRKHKMIKLCPGLLKLDYIKLELKEFIKKIVRWDKRKSEDKSAQLESRAKKAMSNWLREFGWEKEANLTQSQCEALERSWLILQRDFEYCYERNIEPVVIIPPFNHHLKELMPSNILEECLWKYIDRIMLKGIRVLNFWNDEELQKDEYYNTSICLNEAGKKIFNSKVEKFIFRK